MANNSLCIALITEVFFDDPTGERLRRALVDARSQGADLALLPEIPLNRWSPASKQISDEDAEELEDYLVLTLNKAIQRAGDIHEKEVALAAKSGMPNIPGLDLLK